MRRRAKAADVPAMVRLLKERSDHCADFGRLTFDEKLARDTALNCVRHAHGYAAVAEIDGQIEGLLCGILQPYYGLAVELEATDLWWVATERCSARDKVGLMLEFTQWAEAHPKVRTITCGVTKMMGDTGPGEKVLDMLGFERWGSLWRKAAQVKEVAA